MAPPFLIEKKIFLIFRVQMISWHFHLLQKKLFEQAIEMQLSSINANIRSNMNNSSENLVFPITSHKLIQHLFWLNSWQNNKIHLYSLTCWIDDKSLHFSVCPSKYYFMKNKIKFKWKEFHAIKSRGYLAYCPG